MPLFTDVNHLCVVTGDMDRAVRAWSGRYGIGPWEIWTKDGSNMSSVVDGEPRTYTMRAAMCQVSPTFRVELIQPLDEHGPYAESLARFGGRDHVHHVRFDVADYEAARMHLERTGLRVAADEEFAGAPGVESRFRATYFNTEDELGFVLQIGQAPIGFEMPPPDEVYPPG
jgi:hypothetical protein